MQLIGSLYGIPKVCYLVARVFKNAMLLLERF